MLILHVPIPLHLHERLWLKAAWQVFCSPLLLSSFPQPFLAAQQPHAKCLFPVLPSSWRKVTGKGLVSLCGCILKSPSMARAAADDQNPTSPPWHWTVLTLSCSGTHSGAVLAAPLQSCPAEPEQGCCPALHPPHPSFPLRLLPALHLRGEWEHRQLRHQTTPGHRAQLFPSALGYAAIWHTSATRKTCK